MTLPRLTDIEQRAQNATERPWVRRTPNRFSDSWIQGADIMGHRSQVALRVSDERDAEFIAHSRQDVPALSAAIRAVLELHRPKHAVFSWKTGLRYDDPCAECYGKAGVHECGCWAEDDTEYVCQTCADAPWPCATQQAIAQYINLEVTNV